MQTLKRKIAVNAENKVSSVWLIPESYRASRKVAVILAHGAGNDMENPFLSYVHEQLAQKGVMTVKFNFPYKERGGKAPDRAPLLEETWRKIIAAVQEDDEFAPKNLFLAGKSMGGRIASHLAAQGQEFNGLIFLGYPLHPPNKLEKLRAEHLASIQCPMLFIQGTRDSLCDLDLLRTALKTVKAQTTLHVIEGGDHSFKTLKRLGRSELEVWKEIVDTVFDWANQN